MDYRIFNVHTDVNACDCTRGCTDTERESALKVDCRKKIPCLNGESNPCQRRGGPVLKPAGLHHHHHHYHHQSLNSEGRWGTTDDFATSFLHFLCSPLPSGTCWTPGLTIPWCCLPTSFSVCLVFFPLSLCLARWFWSDLMNGRHVHTTSVRVSLTMVWRSSCDPIACWILAQTSSLVTWSLCVDA